ncbi:PfkB family carbohydrate kinase [Sinomicrobium sp. M5D2P9]
MPLARDDMKPEKKHKIVTFGEILMRLSPQDYNCFVQAQQADIFYGGTEANVAVALARMGCETSHVTTLPDDFTGASAKGHLNRYGVDTSFVACNNAPLGIYFLEQGVVHRPGRIVYNRSHSSFAKTDPDEFDWEKILDNASWFHWTGITPAISSGASRALEDALQVAHNKGITVSTDPVYRSNLWQYDADPSATLREMVALSAVFMGGPEEINMLFGTYFEEEEFEDAAKFLMVECPAIRNVVQKTRSSVNASRHEIASRCWDGKRLYVSDPIEITPVVDRIGTGDAFAAGLIYGMLHYNWDEALQFANATSALKHTIPGDACLLSADDITGVIRSGFNGRIIR